MNLAMCEVPVHPVEFLTAANIAALPELPMTQDSDGTYYCDGESTQETGYGVDFNQLLIDGDFPTNQSAWSSPASSIELSVKDGIATITLIATKPYDFYLRQKLTKPLVIGHKYYIRYDVLCHSADAKVNSFFVGMETDIFHKSLIESDTWIPSSCIYENKYENSYICLGCVGTLVSFSIGDFFKFKNAYIVDLTQMFGEGYEPSTVAEFEAMFPEAYYPYTESSKQYLVCERETAYTYPSPDYPSPIINIYPAGTYKAICGDKIYKVVLDDDLRSVPGVADRVRIDAGRGCMWVERKVAVTELDGSTDELWGIRTDTDNAYYSQIIKVSNNATPSLCDKFLKTTTISALKDGYYYTGTSSASFRNDDTQTIGEWKEWLSQNPVTVQYCLITPTTHQSIPPVLTTISSGRSMTIPNTVNDAVDMLAVKGDSWQLVQEEITDADGNVTQPAMPRPEYPSEIVSVEVEMESSGWNIADITGFSATGGNVNELTNNYGTKISTTEPTNKLIVTQTPNNDYGASSYYNGYVIVKLKNKMIAGRKYIVSFDIDITANPLNADFIVIMANGIEGFRIKLQENGKHRATVIWNAYSSRNYLEIRCMGMSFILSNIQITEETQERPYDRHRGNSITLPTLRSLPDGTADVLHVDRAAKRAWVERCVGEIVITGEETGYNNNGQTTNGLYRVTLKPKNYLQRVYGRCTHYPITINTEKFGVFFGQAINFITDNDMDYMKEYLASQYDAGTPVAVHYALATPTIEELPYSDYLLQTAQYETNLTVDCNEHLEPEISATVKVLGR